MSKSVGVGYKRTRAAAFGAAPQPTNLGGPATDPLAMIMAKMADITVRMEALEHRIQATEAQVKEGTERIIATLEAFDARYNDMGHLLSYIT